MSAIDLSGHAMGKTWLGRDWSFALAGDDGLVELNGVLGYLHPGDCCYLFDLAAKLPPGGRYLEIGSFMGLSAICYATGLLANFNTSAEVHCLDTWRGSPEHQHIDEVRDGRLLLTFMANVLGAGVAELVTPHKGTARGHADSPWSQYDAIFVDADHGEAAVYEDVTVCLDRLLRLGGLICGHDCKPGEGVEKALVRIARERGLTAAVIPEPATHWIWELYQSPADVPAGRKVLGA